MATNTSRLGLLKKDTATDGNDTFNIKTMLNDNWDKIDAKVATLGADGKVPADQLSISVSDASTTQKGVVMLEDSVTSTSITKAATSKSVKTVNDALDAHKTDFVSHPGTGTTTNSGNAYAVTLNPVPSSYVDKMGLILTINADSTGVSTINVNGLGAKGIKKANGNDVTNLKNGGIYSLRYNSTTGNFILQGEGGSGNAIASDLLSGKTASTDAGDIIGAMPNRGTFNLGLGEAVPAGYYNGGNVPSGVKKANGTITSASSATTIPRYDGSWSSAAYIPFDMSVLGFVPSTIKIYRTNKSVLSFEIWNKDNYYDTGSTYANSYANSTGYRVPYSNGVVNIPVGNLSSQYDWVAYG